MENKEKTLEFLSSERDNLNEIFFKHSAKTDI